MLERLGVIEIIFNNTNNICASYLNKLVTELDEGFLC